MSEHPAQGWIGASVLRKEDARHLLGLGSFIGDIRLPGMKDVAFLRSQVAHGVLKAVRKPEQGGAQVFTAKDLSWVKVLEAGPELTNYGSSPYPALAEGKVRYAGQTIAACIGVNRAHAEDLTELVEVDIDSLPAVTDVREAMRPGAPKLFDHWADNAFIRASVNEGDAASLKSAPVRVSRQFRMNRQATVHLEGRGTIAYFDRRNDELIVYMSSQGPHVMRLGLAQALGLPEHRIRVIAPDVGGGFGGKNRLMPEDIAVAAIALKVGHPVRWIEDRREHLIASVHARDHFYDLTAFANQDGTLLGVEGSVYIDAGAYSLWPTG
jgi:carbon-monoxide dehydrogenase large subunit